VDDSGFLEDTRQTTGVVWLACVVSEVWKTMVGTCGLYNLGGSAIGTERTRGRGGVRCARGEGGGSQ
jgi:hypothetical protein